MPIYTVKYSAPEPVADEVRRTFEAHVLELWRATVEGRKVIVSVEKKPGCWPAYTGNFSNGQPIGCACETVQSEADA